jgi:hypothetical protein
MIDQFSPSTWCFDHQFVNPWCVFALVELRYSPHREDDVGVASQHQLLECAGFLVIARLGCPKDPLS